MDRFFFSPQFFGDNGKRERSPKNWSSPLDCSQNVMCFLRPELCELIGTCHGVLASLWMAIWIQVVNGFCVWSEPKKVQLTTKTHIVFSWLFRKFREKLEKRVFSQKEMPCYGLISLIPAFHFMDLHWIIEMRVEQAAKRGRVQAHAGTANCKAWAVLSWGLPCGTERVWWSLLWLSTLIGRFEKPSVSSSNWKIQLDNCKARGDYKVLGSWMNFIDVFSEMFFRNVLNQSIWMFVHYDSLGVDNCACWYVRKQWSTCAAGGSASSTLRTCNVVYRRKLTSATALPRCFGDGGCPQANHS